MQKNQENNFEINNVRCPYCEKLMIRTKKCYEILEGENTDFGLYDDFDMEIKCKNCRRIIWIKVF